MRPLFALLLLIPLPAVGALPEFTADYDFERGRMKIGETRMQLERSQENIYRYTSESAATGFVSIFVDDVIKEESIFRLEDGKFWPVSYEYRQLNSSKNRDESIAFDWTDDVARVNYRGHESEHPLKPGMLDRFLLQLAVTHHVKDDDFDRTYRVIDNNRVKDFRLKGQDGKTVRTPAGSFRAVLVERVDKDSDKTLRMWLAPELDFLPVKIEQEKRNEETLRLTLKRFRQPSETASD